MLQEVPKMNRHSDRLLCACLLLAFTAAAAGSTTTQVRTHPWLHTYYASRLAGTYQLSQPDSHLLSAVGVWEW